MSRSSLFLCCKMKWETKLLKLLHNGVVKCHLVKRWLSVLSECLTGLPKAHSMRRGKSCEPSVVRQECWEYLMGMSATAQFSDPVRYVMYLPVGYRRAEQQHLSVSQSLSVPVSWS